MLFTNKMLALAALLLPSLVAATQPPVTVSLFTAPNCVAAAQIGSVDVSAKIFTVTSPSCVPAPNQMTMGLVSYLSYRTYFTIPPPSGTLCVTTVYSDAACQTKLHNLALRGGPCKQ
ncbi:MAG: hypothetical protein Q9204_002073 [Flavoplaca sp. TL-2023a]